MRRLQSGNPVSTLLEPNMLGLILGEDLQVVMVSTGEGEDKPLKYPKIFDRSECRSPPGTVREVA